jgi:hypothetical protein
MTYLRLDVDGFYTQGINEAIVAASGNAYDQANKYTD